MTRKLSDRNTKAELLEGYVQLQEEKKALESQLKQLQKEPKDKLPIVTDKQSQPQGTAMSQPQTVKDKMSYTIDSLVKLQLGFGSAISDLSEKLTSEAAKLEVKNNWIFG